MNINQAQLMEELYEAVNSHKQTFDQALFVLVEWGIIDPDLAADFFKTSKATA